MYKIPVDATHSVRGSRAGELCARCVVETGTSSFYSAIRDAVDEPVLKQICKNIAADEFRHYRLVLRPYGALPRRAAPTPSPADGSASWVAVTRFQEASDDEIASAYHAGNAIAGRL